MNEEYLQGFFDTYVKPKRPDANYNDWVSKISSNEEYKQGMFNTYVKPAKADATYEDWNGKIFGQKKTSSPSQRVGGVPQSGTYSNPKDPFGIGDAVVRQIYTGVTDQIPKSIEQSLEVLQSNLQASNIDEYIKRNKSVEFQKYVRERDPKFVGDGGFIDRAKGFITPFNIEESLPKYRDQFVMDTGMSELQKKIERKQPEIIARRQALEKYVQQQNLESAAKLGTVPQSYKDVKSVTDAARYAANMAAQGLWQIPLTVVTRGASGLAMESAEVYDQQLDQLAEKYNISREEVINRNLDKPAEGQFYATVAAGLDRFSAGGLLNLVKKGGSKGVEKLLAITTETLTEPTQGALEEMGGAAGAGKDVSEAFEKAWTVNLSKRLDESLGGFFGSAGPVVISSTQTQGQPIPSTPEQGQNQEQNAPVENVRPEPNKQDSKVRVEPNGNQTSQNVPVMGTKVSITQDTEQFNAQREAIIEKLNNGEPLTTEEADILTKPQEDETPQETQTSEVSTEPQTPAVDETAKEGGDQTFPKTKEINEDSDWGYLWRGDVVSRGNRGGITSPLEMIANDVLSDINTLIEDFSDLNGLSKVDGGSWKSWNEVAEDLIKKQLSLNADQRNKWDDRSGIYKDSEISLDVNSIAEKIASIIDFDKAVQLLKQKESKKYEYGFNRISDIVRSSITTKQINPKNGPSLPIPPQQQPANPPAAQPGNPKTNTEVPGSEGVNREVGEVERLAVNLDKGLDTLPSNMTGFKAHFTSDGYRTEFRKEGGKYNLYLTNETDGRYGIKDPKLSKSKLSKPIESFDNAKDAAAFALDKYNEYSGRTTKSTKSKSATQTTQIPSVNFSQAEARAKELTDSIEQLKKDNPSEFKKDGTIKAKSKIAPSLKALMDMRDDAYDNMRGFQEEFNQRARQEAEKSRLESEQLSREFDERQKELQKSMYPEDLQDEQIFDEVNRIFDKVNNDQTPTQQEIEYINQNAFLPNGYVFTETGLKKGNRSQATETSPTDTKEVNLQQEKALSDAIDNALPDLNYLTEDELLNTSSPVNNKLKQKNIKKEQKQLKLLIQCLTK